MILDEQIKFVAETRVHSCPNFVLLNKLKYNRNGGKTMVNITEVVFGDSLYHEIKISRFSKNNKIIKFGLLFSICDLSNIDKGILTLNNEYCDLISSEIYDISNTSSLKDIINGLEESIKNNNKIRIWTTHKQIDSYLMFLYVCNYFSNIDANLYVLFSDEFDSDFFSPSCMNEKELEELSKLEHKLTKDEIKRYSNEWNKIINDNLDMRIVENNKVKSVTFDYYNDIILNKLNELGEVKVVGLVGRLMSDIHLYDTVFTYLIYRLIKEEKIIVIYKDQRYWKSIIKVKKEEM